MTRPGLPLTATLLAASSLTVMANATISPSLPGLAEAFRDTPGIETLAGAVLSLPSLAIILTAGLFGWLADRIDRRTLLIAMMLVYALGGASGLVAQTMPQILVGRLILGVGVAGVMTLAVILAADFFEGDARRRFMGWQGAAMSGGGIVFLLAGGALAEAGWRLPFLIYLAAAPLALAAWLALPPRPPAPRRADEPAAPFPWARFAPVGALGFFTMLLFYLVPTRVPFLLPQIGIPAPSAAGIAVAGVTATSFCTSLMFGRIRKVLSPQAIFAAAFLLMAAGYLVIAASTSLVMVLAGTLIAGLGLGTTMPNMSSWLMDTMPEAARGRASGLLTTSVFAGQFASPLIAGAAGAILPLPMVFAAFAAAAASVAAFLLFSRTSPKASVAP